MQIPKIALILGGAVLIAGVVTAVFLFSTCSPIPQEEKQMGSQGYRIWSGPTLQTFDHHNKKICVPEGWQAVGATESGKGWAKFENGMTGVVIRPSAFASTTLEFQNSSYVVTVLYPGSELTPLTERYIAAITNAFERTGAIFGDSSKKNPKRPHTVLITPGIEGTTPVEGAIDVYPDPRENLSIFVQNVDSVRGEELFIHAVTHIYNRFRKDLLGYQSLQSPVPASDWQELEAVWAETAFRPSTEGKFARLRYLYNIHTAVQTHNFGLIAGEPFNNKDAFDRITPSVVLGKNPTYLDAQYGHYVLGALSLVATEGLLKKYGTHTTLDQIFFNLHTNRAENFFTEIDKVLPKAEAEAVRGWMLDGKLIPRDLVFSAYAN